eukprot:1713062-Prymnesium_polylepis.1
MVFARDTALTVLASGCVLWTMALAAFKYLSPAVLVVRQADDRAPAPREREVLEVVETALPDRCGALLPVPSERRTRRTQPCATTLPAHPQATLPQRRRGHAGSARRAELVAAGGRGVARGAGAAVACA